MTIEVEGVSLGANLDHTKLSKVSVCIIIIMYHTQGDHEEQGINC